MSVWSGYPSIVRMSLCDLAVLYGLAVFLRSGYPYLVWLFLYSLAVLL